MTQSKHTPGPWVLSGGTNGEWQIDAAAADDGDPWSIAMSFGAAGFNQLDGEEESEANARLIAAAPEMLDALHKAKEWLEGWGSAESQLAVIEAAIANAEGRS